MEWNRWHLVQLTPEAAEGHDRRVHNVSDDCRLGWKPYTYRATRGAVAQWACHTEEELARNLQRHGLRVAKWSEWSNGVRATELI